MSQKSRMLLTLLINIGLVVLLAGSLCVLERVWQERREVKREQQIRQAYFFKMENYLDEVTSFIRSISNSYVGRCDRKLVLHMRKELFNLPGAIELGVIEKDDDHGVVVCNSWGENERIIVREPVPHEGFLITGPHTINSLEMPIYVIKKTRGKFEYNIIIKKSSVDGFLNSHSNIVMSINNRKKGGKYRDSQQIANLSYVIPPREGLNKSTKTQSFRGIVK